jgi:hypothetical protein
MRRFTLVAKCNLSDQIQEKGDLQGMKHREWEEECIPESAALFKYFRL